MNDCSTGATHRTTFQCDNCLENFRVEFADPGSPFSATCPNCNAHYPEVYV